MKITMKFFLFSLLVSQSRATNLFAQSVAINTDGSPANTSSILDIKSINKGLLIPRMTSVQRIAIAAPANGLMVFDITTNSPWFYNGASWNALSAGSPSNYWTLNSTDIFTNTAGNVGIGTATPLSKLSVQTATGNYGITHSDGTVTMGTYIGSGKGWIGSKSNHPLAFFTNNSNEQMTLLPNGNFGIGTTIPPTKLTIHTPNNTDGFSHESDGGIILKDVVGGISAAFGTYSPHTFRLVANSIAAINIDINGNIGVGVTDQAFKMDIADRIRIRSSSVSSTAGISLNNANNSAVNAFIGTKDLDLVGIYGNTSGWGLLMNTNTGAVAIGYQNPVAGYRLSILGNQYINGLLATTGDAEIGADAQISGNLNVGGRMIVGSANQVGQFDLPPLEVNSNVSYQNYNGWTYYDNTSWSFNSNLLSIRAHGAVMADYFISISDIRVKNITAVSNSTKDLETLNALKITDYTMKDKIQYGNKSFKKVIAQEVEKVYPQVISKKTDYIPNVYAIPSKIEKTPHGYLLSFNDKHNLTKTAKKIQVMAGRATNQFDIISIPSDKQLEIKADNLETDKVFVYGEEVDDFRTVDYEGLTTLNISATQELSKLIKKQQTIIEIQQQQIEQLRKRMEAAEKK